eukprot:364387-Chlamydomonas_euryale.AAC.5
MQRKPHSTSCNLQTLHARSMIKLSTFALPPPPPLQHNVDKSVAREATDPTRDGHCESSPTTTLDLSELCQAPVRPQWWRPNAPTAV